MIPASELKIGMVIRLEGQLNQVIACEHHTGGGKMGSLEHVKLRNLATGAILERRFRPGERVELVDVDKQKLEYLYQDGEYYVFMNPQTYEQVPIHTDLLGPKARYLKEELEVTGLFFDEKAIAVLFPEFVEFRVVTSPPPLHDQDTSTYKTIVLENGMEILAPQFIKEGDKVRIDSESGKYAGRV